MRKITVLGSTGSIGKKAVEVIEYLGYEVAALSAGSNARLLEQQCRRLKPKYACLMDPNAARELKIALADTSVKVLSGMDGLIEISSEPDADTLFNSVVGMVGLLPTMAAIKAKKNIALANKETLVAAGSLVMQAARENSVKIIPVDSEHSAIFQCLQGNEANRINKIILTASGGPFLGSTVDMLRDVKIEEVLNHPNWQMGPKITVDSATLMNKGLELIEAVWLFDIDSSKVEIVVHKQSVIHSMVEFEDYSVLAQLGVPDMSIPIQYALTYPRRYKCNVNRLSITDYGCLNFEKPDYETFKCLSACIRAVREGGLIPCVVNSANEAAVDLFLNQKISFLQIGEIVSSITEKAPRNKEYSLEDVIETDREIKNTVYSSFI